MGSAPRQDGLELARRPTVVIGPTGPAHGEHRNSDVGRIEGRPTPKVRELLDEGPPFSAPLRAGARRQSLPSRVADQPTHEPLGRGLAVVDPPTPSSTRRLEVPAGHQGSHDSGGSKTVTLATRSPRRAQDANTTSPPKL